MFDAPPVEETKEKPSEILNDALQLFQELEKETKSLNEQKTSLLDIEEKLLLKINERIEKERQKREQLKTEVEELRKKCEELVTFVNSRLAESGS
jgi:predicted transcriptional regulator